MSKNHHILAAAATVVCIITICTSNLQGSVVVNIATNDGTGADTQLRGGADVNTNFGALGTASITTNDGNNNFKRSAYLRFDLSSVTPSEISDATLNLVNGFTSPAGDHTLHFYGLNDDENADGWAEGTVAAANAPGILTAATLAPDLTELTDLGTLVVDLDVIDGNDLFSFSSAALTTFLTTDTDGLVTILISRDSATGGGNASVRMKENSFETAPSLALTVPNLQANGTAPEPSSMTLIMLAMLGAGLWRRQRRRP